MGEFTDLIFTLLGKMGRYLNVKGKKVCFIIWAICLLYWSYRNFDMGLMVQTGGCLISFGFHVYGYWNWTKKGIGE
ncbi:hypothetical protein UFOVP844_40 [uncultured Caudovirales phage]|uniref:Uncharacterized protein n=1 Tax=uncultured Caudovirales phage TaxID=2100421 RepID=A0A6J5PG21_9CAUD|nr:hypothetical protein UFOVP844_40 [uncultured Caudovirales phage]